MNVVLPWISSISAVLAAGFWIASALVRIPDVKVRSGAPVLSHGHPLTVPRESSITKAMRKQSGLSAVAAIFAAISAMFQAQISTFILDTLLG